MSRLIASETRDWVVAGVCGPRLDRVLEELCIGRPRASSSGTAAEASPDGARGCCSSMVPLFLRVSLRLSLSGMGCRDDVGEGMMLEGAVAREAGYGEAGLGDTDVGKEGVETCRLDPGPPRSLSTRYDSGGGGASGAKSSDFSIDRD